MSVAISSQRLSWSAIGVALLVVACGGSSKISEGAAGNGESGTGGASNSGTGQGGLAGKSSSTATGGDGGSGGARGGTGGDAGGSLGGSGALGGDSGTFGGGAVGGADGGSTGAVGGDVGVGAVGGSATCEPGNCVCGPGGCTAGDPNVTPIEPPGPALCGGVACASGESCCLATGQCFDAANNSKACAPPPDDADPQGRKACSSSAQCDSGWFCSIESGLCQGTGHCQPISNCGSCEDGGTGVCRVCACDGNTYPNIQTACRAGTFGIYTGAGCGETVVLGSGGAAGSGGAGGSAGGGADPVTPCGTNANCTTKGDACCAITGRCYPTSDPGQCVVPPPGTRFPCTSNAQCYDWEFCQGDGCDGPGGCVSRSGNDDCGVVLAPVCGCDGVSYTSADCATQRGARVASTGACAQ